jgi:hypothetical protein
VTDHNKMLQAWELLDRLDYIEEQLGSLFPDRYVPFTDFTAAKLPPEVVELVRAGKKVAAIQAYMKHAGSGMQEAKGVIDSL